MTHDDLVQIGAAWLRSHQDASVVLTEPVRDWGRGEQPDVYGWLPVPKVSCIIECKTSREDFKADWSKEWRMDPNIGMGNFRWYLVPTGLVDHSDLPHNWGLLVTDGDDVVEDVAPIGFAISFANLLYERIMLLEVMRRLMAGPRCDKTNGFLQRVEDVLRSEDRIDASLAIRLAGGPPDGMSTLKAIGKVCDAMDRKIISGTHHVQMGKVEFRL